ncbi:PREDICTED: adipocyte enhancer-binding protein 1-like [Branchiostoma belcheri]|uniref:Adipocyte enhancer-binding protein 1-like n=1 Tax=Branchiostoma belcheri TaxID=7741 RepID=A0A6P4YBS7_BRABE|nr:PREDICTED: adipocyte enhancer-binding protein 1-like [Branchiostoma belcheri]
MENAAATITASSVHPHCSTEKAILNSQRDGTLERYAAGWCADNGFTSEEWLQVDLNSLTNVSGVITQGRGDIGQYVRSYKLTFSADGVVWEIYSEDGQEKVVFAGNADSNTEVEHLIAPPVTARFVRFLPLTWGGWISMRMEVLLCAPGTDVTEAATTTPLVVTTTTPDVTTTTPAVTTTTPAVSSTTTAVTTTTPAVSTTTQAVTTITPAVTSTTPAVTSTTHAATTTAPAFTTTMSVSTTTITTNGAANMVTTAMSGEAPLTTSRPGEGESAAANKGEARGGAVAGGVVGAMVLVGAGLAVSGFLMYKKKNNATVEPSP